MAALSSSNTSAGILSSILDAYKSSQSFAPPNGYPTEHQRALFLAWCIVVFTWLVRVTAKHIIPGRYLSFNASKIHTYSIAADYIACCTHVACILHVACCMLHVACCKLHVALFITVYCTYRRTLRCPGVKWFFRGRCLCNLASLSSSGVGLKGGASGCQVDIKINQPVEVTQFWYNNQKTTSYQRPNNDFLDY